MSVTLPNGRYDPMLRRQATRKQRERGCSVYIAAEELQKAGIALDGPPPYYRTRSYAGRRSVVIQLYREP